MGMWWGGGGGRSQAGWGGEKEGDLWAMSRVDNGLTPAAFMGTHELEGGGWGGEGEKQTLARTEGTKTSRGKRQGWAGAPLRFALDCGGFADRGKEQRWMNRWR